VLTHFSPTDICESKKLIVQLFRDHLADGSVLTERRSSTTRSSHEAELEDIFAAFDVLHSCDVLNGQLFTAVNLDDLPKYGLEDFNLGAIVHKQTRTETAVTTLTEELNCLKAASDNTRVFDTNSSLQQVSDMVKALQSTASAG